MACFLSSVLAAGFLEFDEDTVGVGVLGVSVLVAVRFGHFGVRATSALPNEDVSAMFRFSCADQFPPCMEFFAAVVSEAGWYSFEHEAHGRISFGCVSRGSVAYSVGMTPSNVNWASCLGELPRPHNATNPQPVRTRIHTPTDTDEQHHTHERVRLRQGQERQETANERGGNTASDDIPGVGVLDPRASVTDTVIVGRSVAQLGGMDADRLRGPPRPGNSV